MKRIISVILIYISFAVLTSARWKAELYTGHFFGTLGERGDDYTADIFARLTIPLFSPRVNLVVYGPLYEWFHS